MATPASLLTTKLFLPPVRPNRVPRPRLITRLNEDLPVTLVAAPAGYGKTTLLSDWIPQSPRCVTWVSLDEGDNDPLVFWAYCVAALQRLDPDLGQGAVGMLRTPQPPMTGFLTALLNDLAEFPDGFALVLDDYHIITAPAVHEGLAYLLQHLPPRGHVIVTSRIDPLGLPLARLRARDQLTELRVNDLRFTPEEVSAFLNDGMALNLSAGDVAALGARTEGWIAALHLAALAMRDRTDLASFVTAFAGSHRFVVDYLAEEVFARQPPHIQSFLLQTSILDRMCGALCDALVAPDALERPAGQTLRQDDATVANGQRILEQLERANLFTVPLDDTRRWYRYHHLFAEVLRERLRSGASAETIAELHRRAGAWFEQNGFVIEAVQHALAGADWARAADLTEQHGLDFIVHGQAWTVLRWLHAIPESFILAHPALATIHASTLIFDQQLEAAELRLQAAEASLAAGAAPDQVQLVQGRVAALRANILLIQGDFSRAIAMARQGLALLPASEATMRAIAASILARAYEVSGDVTAASEQLAAGVLAQSRTAGNLMALMRNLAFLARLQMLQGRLRAAARTYAEAAQTHLPEPALRHLYVAYEGGWGDLLREQNDLAAAEPHLRLGMALARDARAADAHSVLLSHVAFARFQQAQGDGAGASATLADFADLAQESGFAPQLSAQAAAVGAQLRLAQGDLAAAIGWAETSGPHHEDGKISFPREREDLVLARVLTRQSRPEAALRLLDRLLEDAETKARMHSAIEILILRALARDAEGERSAGLMDLARALSQAEPEGYVRIFVDEGTPLAALLVNVAQDQSAIAPYAARLLAAFPAELKTEPDVSTTAPISLSRLLAEPLTNRELEVLRLIAAGRSNQEIANTLIIAVSTVKRHVNNIYGKLAVASRTQALARARDVGLI